jgi:acylphosphatase
LLHLDGHSPARDCSDGSVYVVVHGDDDRYVGLMVHRILDISPAAQPMDTSQKRLGYWGRTLIDDQVLDVVDIEALARSAGIVYATEPVPGVTT